MGKKDSERKEKKAKKHSKDSKSHKRHKSRRKSSDEVSVSSTSSSSSDESSHSSSSGLEKGEHVQIYPKEDYFKFNEEFRIWLSMMKKISFDKLTSDESHELFHDFAKLFNRRKLPKMFYEGIPLEVREEFLRSKHKWSFKLSNAEKDELTQVSDSVDVLTRTKHVKEY